MRGHRDLTLAVRAAIVSALLGVIIPLEWLSLLAAAPLILLLPGYGLASAAFARRARGLVQLLALTLGLSLAVLAIGSLLLNFVPGGLRAVTWAVFLVLVTVLACRAAALRRGRGYLSPLLGLPWRRPRPLGTALVVAGAALAALGVALAFVAFKAPDVIGYSELWIEPAHGPRSAVLVGVGSEEQEVTAYRLATGYAGSAPSSSGKFSLDPGESKVLRVPVREPRGGPRKVVATLYRVDRPGRPYRRVSAWVGTERGG